MGTYVLLHGAWAGGWQWREVARLLQPAGHEVFTPTLTGLADRKHLLTPDVGLETHIQDVVGLIEYEELRAVLLVGHSYGGMVISGVAERVPERIAHLVFVDALIPRDGESGADILGRESWAWMEERAPAGGDGWRLPSAGEDRDSDHPLKTFSDHLAVANPAAAALPRTVIHCKPPEQAGIGIGCCAARSKAEGWRYHELPTGYVPQETMPRELTDLLLEAASGP